MGLRPLYFLICPVRGPSESDVCRRQILTSKDGPRSERVKAIVSLFYFFVLH